MDMRLIGMNLVGVGVYLIGVHPIGMHLMGGPLIGMYLTGMYIMGMYLMGMHLLGMHASRGHASHGQCSSLPIQAQARGKSLPELRKACGLPGLLVIIDERGPWEQGLLTRCGSCSQYCFRRLFPLFPYSSPSCQMIEGFVKARQLSSCARQS
jgi:hypothetical protein